MSGTEASLPVYENRLSLANRLARLAWGIVRCTVFRLSPAPLHPWRSWLLRLFGARIGSGVHVYPSAKVWAPWNLSMADGSALADGVDCYCVAPITIGRDVTVSQDAFLCTASHDISDPQRRLVTKPIVLSDNSWVFARAFVGPGVRVGEGAVVAACAVAVKDVPPWAVVGGNPARFLKQRSLRSGAGAQPLE